MMKEKKRVGEEATLAGSDGDDEVPDVDWLSAGALLYLPKPQVRIEKLQYVI